MWHIEINEKKNEKNIVELTISIADSVFLDFLLERRDLYPIYIRHNTFWLSIRNPYQPYITPFPETGAYKIRINEQMTFKFSNRLFKLYRQKFETSLVLRLLEWLDEEYKTFQDEWKLKSTPLYLS